jgi:hypothetical protein
MNTGIYGALFPFISSFDYFSDFTVIEYDMLIIDLQEFFPPTGQTRNQEKLEKRSTQLKEFIEKKNMPVVFFSTMNHSGPVRNPRAQVTSLNINEFLPVPKYYTVSEIGRKITVVNNTIFTSFAKRYLDYFMYDSYFSNFQGTAILEIPHSRKVIGFYNETCVFLPRVNANQLNKNRQDEFLKDLYEIVFSIRNSSPKIPAPAWISEYIVPGEKLLRDENANIRSQILDLQKKLEQNEFQLQSILDKKTLFYGTGSDLEYQIEQILKELGFEIVRAEKDRADLIIKYEDKFAVVEIKGLQKSAAESNAAQLEKWVANFVEFDQPIPKGILIVNAFRETPLTERTTPAFPHQMLNYSVKRDHCLITTTQLLGLYYKGLESPEDKKDLVMSLFDTVGIFKGFQEWEKFIQIDGIKP